jgi:voltage-gated potassium channel Kch
MSLYRITEPRLGRLHVHAWRHRAQRTIGLLLLTLLSCMVGLALLDPSEEALSHKTFVALWNAGNLISTVGDFTPLTAHQKAFVLVAMFSFVIIGGYAVSTLTGILSSDAVMAYRENRSMERILDRLTNHIVLVGFGAIGRLVAAQLHAAGERVLVIDRDATLAARASELGYHVVEGDAGVDPNAFERAGIERAKALVVTTEDPDRKVAITLLGHALKPDLRIVVTGRNDPRGALLRRAGASDVVVIDDLVADALLDRLGANVGTGGGVP